MDLPELRALSRAAVEALPPASQKRFEDEFAKALIRSDRSGVTDLIEEFQASLSVRVARIEYELAFLPRWSQMDRPLYQTRWWINEYDAGVYFVYDASAMIRFVGAACGDSLGRRLWSERHEGYWEYVDVVLFHRRWCHLARALEVLAISRLRPSENSQFKELWIEPPVPFDDLWNESSGRRTAQRDDE